MSKTVVPAEPGWPADFQFEQLYSLYPNAIERWDGGEWNSGEWDSGEWDIYFSKLNPSERIELCDRILAKNDVYLKTAVELAYAVARCGDSQHVCWRQLLKNLAIDINEGEDYPKEDYIGEDEDYPIEYLVPARILWKTILYHARTQVKLGHTDHDHEELADIIGGSNGQQGMVELSSRDLRKLSGKGKAPDPGPLFFYGSEEIPIKPY